DFAIMAPGWSGRLPEGVRGITAPTPNIWVLGRTQTDGAGDFQSAHAVQDAYRLTPLGQWGKPRVAPKPVPTDLSIDAKTPPFYQLNELPGVEVLARLSDLLRRHPPHGADYPMLFRLRRLGIEAGKPLDPATLPAGLADTLNAAAKDALAEIVRA